ncbi:MAG: pseudouridine-5'-phosphate glycosidase [Deinococcus sp.]|nr:pseudouridine-5'-phosphate glycosidase [Deinococcus sp.]
MRVSASVQQALAAGQPVVALESTVISHGLPRPTNLALALELEDLIRAQGATPATVGIIHGEPVVGLGTDEITLLANATEVEKVSLWNLAATVIQGRHGATTVSATAFLASRAGIEVFATGGIGGVHRGEVHDVSADLYALERYPVLVVASGAKSILDLEATVETLETLGVPVVGYRTGTLPGFYLRDTGIAISARVESPQEAAQLWKTQRSLGLGGMILANPIPQAAALERQAVERWLKQALADAQRSHTSGKALTPFLLDRLRSLSHNRTLEANLALLRDNAVLAAQVAAGG